MRLDKWSHAGIGRSVGRVPAFLKLRLASAPLRWPHPGFALLEVGTSIHSPLIHSIKGGVICEMHPVVFSLMEWNFRVYLFSSLQVPQFYSAVAPRSRFAETSGGKALLLMSHLHWLLI
jgi:hypothetical protein